MSNKPSRIRSLLLFCTLLVVSPFYVNQYYNTSPTADFSISVETSSVDIEYTQEIHDYSSILTENPISNQEFFWGWQGNLSFEYWNETFDQGIENATVQYWWAYTTGFAYEIGNGTY
ncbi:MAG: hypothetical protein ACFFBL_13730, partial [Promethearchaeota archaeon]